MTETAEKKKDLTENIETACYVHVPFCRHKCIYCDFYSIITDKNLDGYLEALKKEIEYYAALYGGSRKLNTIFFGGGTPSLLPSALIEQIINELYKNFGFIGQPEITLETNPGTVDSSKLKSFRKIGVNRLSIGVQSFIDSELAFLTRIHDSQTASKTILEAHNSGFENINVDLIFNLPGQTSESWAKNLSNAAALPVTHISTYSLILERGTILNKMVLDGKVEIGDADYDADLYEYTINYLSGKGFNHYEVSNFCIPGKECLHNLFYWKGKDYIGFGPSAHSTISGKRWRNYSSLKMYIGSVSGKGHAAASSEVLTQNQIFQEYLMLNLRAEGLDLIELENRFGMQWFESNKNIINQLVSADYLIKTDDFIKFTAIGYSVCDEILSRFK